MCKSEKKCLSAAVGHFWAQFVNTYTQRSTWMQLMWNYQNQNQCNTGLTFLLNPVLFRVLEHKMVIRILFFRFTFRKWIQKMMTFWKIKDGKMTWTLIAAAGWIRDDDAGKEFMEIFRQGLDVRQYRITKWLSICSCYLKNVYVRHLSCFKMFKIFWHVETQILWTFLKLRKLPFRWLFSKINIFSFLNKYIFLLK